jgi:hypothetical protein
MPELVPAFATVRQTPAGPFGNAPQTDRRAWTALRLAGAPSPATGPEGEPDARTRVLEALRIAVGTPNHEVRAAALAPLADGAASGWTPALAATLRLAATRNGFAVPAALQQRIDAMPEPGGLWDRLVSIHTLWVLGWGLIVAWIGSWHRHAQRRHSLWGPLALMVAIAWIGVRLQIGGVVCNPTYVGLAVAALLTLRGRLPWTRLRIALVAVQLLFVGWAALAWFGQVTPPHNLGFWIAMAILLSGMPLRFDGIRRRRRRGTGSAAVAASD